MNCCKVNKKKISFLYTKTLIRILFQRVNFYTSSAAQKLDFYEEFTSQDSYYAKLEHSMRVYATSGYIREALEVLNTMKIIPGRPSVYDYNALIHSLFKSNNVMCNDLVDVYADMKRYGPCPNALTYNTLLNGLLSRGVLEYAVAIAEEMWTSGFVPSFTIMSKMLKKLLESGNLANAFSVFKFMLQLNYFPSEPTLNMLIVRLSKAGMISDAYSVFSVLLDLGYFRGAYNYNPILWALCRRGQSYTALRLVYFLKKKGIVHDERSYTALVYGFSREKLEFEILSCFKEMIIEGCKQNVITHTIVLKFLCDDGKTNEALDLLSTMKKVGPPPDIITYNIIIRKLCQQGKFYEVDGILQEKDLLSDLFTHAALAGGLLKGGRVGKATEYFLDVIMKEKKLDPVICNIYLNIQCQPSMIGADETNAKSCRMVLKLFDRNGIKPNTISCNTILKSLSVSNINSAFEFVDSEDWGENWPDIISFNTILSAACKQRNRPMIQRILNRMEVEQRLEYNVVGLTCLIQYACEIGKITEGIMLLSDMILYGPSPTLVTFNTLINSLCKNGLVKVAYGLFRYMRRKGFLPDLITYNILIRASIREGNHQLMCHLIKDMSNKGLDPDIVTFSSFVYWLLKEDEIRNACKFSPGIGVYNLIMKEMLKRCKLKYVKLLLKKMAAEGCEPDSETIEIINRAISKGWIKQYTAAKLLVSGLSSIEEKEAAD